MLNLASVHVEGHQPVRAMQTFQDLENQILTGRDRSIYREILEFNNQFTDIFLHLEQKLALNC